MRFLRTPGADVNLSPVHPVFQRMQKPNDVKRMVVILDPANYNDWLQSPMGGAKEYFRQWHGPLDAFASPLPPRKKS